ncbi:MAG: FkbM family methyltransferase [Desulfuromonadaceae bacterium]
MITREKSLYRKLRTLALRTFLSLDNSGTADFDTNGEKKFVEKLFDFVACSEQGHAVFFDIGANVGEYTEMLLEKSSKLPTAPEIHVFEPTSSCFGVITAKFSARDNVVLNNLAVSSSADEVEIYFDAEQSTLASLHKRNLEAYSIKLNRSETVTTIRLDTYIERRGITHIHFLKIDIEGHEIAAFEGLGHYLSGDFIDFVQFEYGGANLDSHTNLMDFYALFDKAGFVITKVMRKGLEARPYKPWMDNFQYANYVAVSKKIIDELK